MDVLFANAGIAPFVSFEAVTEEHFDGLFNINVRGLFFTVQKALPLLSEGASVILNASVAAQSRLPNTSIYSATKAAVRSLGRTLATELSPRGIRVNVVSPGLIETPFWGKIGLKHDTRLVREAKGTPQHVNLYGYVYNIDTNELSLVVEDEGAQSARTREIVDET